MLTRIVSYARAAALLACLALLAPAAQRNDEVTRSFVRTRGTEVVTAGRRRPKPKPKPAGPLGLGYTLFKRAADGALVRVNPAQEFRGGDQVRFVIESNTAGYLYIFHQENDAAPKMIYPDARLKWGDNRIAAHAQHEVPSSQEPGDWWFNLVGPAATERFYLVVTRQPLPAVWTGAKLVAHCQRHPNDCPWKPAETTWKQLLAGANIGARESRSPIFGEVQTEVERKELRREVKLRPNDPAPAVIKVSTSPTAKILLATVALVHK